MSKYFHRTKDASWTVNEAIIDQMLIDERWHDRKPLLVPAWKIFDRKFAAVLKEKLPDGSLRFPDTINKSRLQQIAHDLFTDYFDAFNDKLSMGEVWEDRYPGTPMEDNVGYLVGNTSVNKVTEYAYNRINHFLAKDGSEEARAAAEKQTMAILSKLILVTLHTVRILSPRDADPREKDPAKQLIFADPRPRLLGPEEKARITELIHSNPVTSIDKWADHVSELPQRHTVDRGGQIRGRHPHIEAALEKHFGDVYRQHKRERQAEEREWQQLMKEMDPVYMTKRRQQWAEVHELRAAANAKKNAEREV